MAIEDFFQQTISIQKAGTLNDFGTKATGTSVSIRGRVERTSRLLIGGDGRQGQVVAEIYIAAGADVAKEDVIVVDSEKMLVLDVEKNVHGSGSEHHWRLIVGRRQRG